ncbi:unnamed protein product [Bemisia tabaci]|uniref:Uncharacterized protein n=1 Tax=Bemisia tabaci TaxID=7038 RepID=A0A9P0AD97_BEMTA|nr:unnamed protein product [Bemisia tabaci]
MIDQVYLGKRGEADAALLIYGNSELIKKYAEDVTEIHMDGTFKAKPQKPACAQLFTLMAMLFGVVISRTLDAKTNAYERRPKSFAAITNSYYTCTQSRASKAQSFR